MTTGKTYDQLDERVRSWIADQRMFFVAPAPSGAETIAYLRDNGRITLMCCAFSGPPRILRLHGQGRIALPGKERWDEVAGRFPARRGARAVVVVDLQRIADSCGYAVPLYDHAGQRHLLEQWTQRRDDAAIADRPPDTCT